MAIERFQQLDAWQYAHKLVLALYRTTRSLPPEERFGLTLQMRRAAVSVPANIAEGFKRRTSKDKVHFYNISESSLEELKYYLMLCADLDYVNSKEVEILSTDAEQVSRLLGGLIRSISAK